MSRGAWKRLLAGLLVAAAAWFLADAIITNWQALRAFEWSVDPLRLVASLAAHVAVLGWGVWVWHRVLHHFEHAPVRQATLLRIWFLSNLARYIPGKIFQFLAVAQLSRAAGLSAAVLLTSLLVHTGLALLSAVVLGAWTLSGALLPAASPLAVGGLTTAVALLLVHPTAINRTLSTGSRLLRRPMIRWRAGWAGGILLLGLSVLSWLFYGAAYALFIAALTPVPLTALPVLAGVNALSFVAGYLALVTPGGLGVREAAMTGLLLPLLPRGVAAVLAIAARLWTIAAELAGGALVLLLVRPRLVPEALEDPDPATARRD